MYNQVFNPNRGLDELLGFNANWNYQSPYAQGNNYQASAPRWGTPQNRSVGADGVTFSLTFIDRPVEQVNYIKRFYDQYQRGYFTIVEWDNFGRHRVGRFITPPKVTPTANMKYNVTVTFTERQNTPMLQYPSNWQQWGYFIDVVDGDGVVQPYTFSAGDEVWGLEANPAIPGASVNNPAQCELLNQSPVAGDYAMLEYVGFGFQMQFRLAANLGVVSVLLDGNAVATGLDLSTGIAQSLGVLHIGSPNYFTNVPTLVLEPGGQSVLLRMEQVMLGRHRLQVVAVNTAQLVGTDYVIFPRVQVIS